MYGQLSEERNDCEGEKRVARFFSVRGYDPIITTEIPGWYAVQF